MTTEILQAAGSAADTAQIQGTQTGDAAVHPVTGLSSDDAHFTVWAFHKWMNENNAYLLRDYRAEFDKMLADGTNPDANRS